MTFQGSGLGSVATTANFGPLTIGASPSANRRVVVIFADEDLRSGTGYTLVSAVFTPNSGSPVTADTLVLIGADTLDGAVIASAVLPVGTTSTLAVTFNNAAFFGPRFAFYTVDNSTLISPTVPVTAYNSAAAATSVTTTVNTLAGGALLGQASSGNSGSTFSGALTGSDGSFGDYLWASASNVSAASPASVTNTWTGTNLGSLALAAYR